MVRLPFRRGKDPELPAEPAVTPGRLVEVPTPEADGMDRRAFGEFCSTRGELASYAFGWTTGSDPHEARFTVGIGAGNPGGATFHAAVFATEDSYAFRLVDEPFESVPEGGPDILAEGARADEDLPFVWFVTDMVMERDPRAGWMRHWLMETWCLETPEVFELDEPVLTVTHDRDGVWQCIGTSDGDEDTALQGHLHHRIDEDPTLVDVLDLEPGERAVRDAPGGAWTRSWSPEEDEESA